MLIGVSNESKGYRLYNPITETVVTSRDVVFEEEKGWNWDKVNEEQLIWEGCESDDESNAETEQSQPPDNSPENQSPLAPEIMHRPRNPPSYLRDYTTGEEL